MPPVMERKVRNYVAVKGTTIERMVFRFLENEVIHRQKTEAQCRVRRFRDLVARQTRLEGEPYVFHRQDAYEGELLAAAERAGADTFLSEDLADGETYCGIKVSNPFK